MDINQSFSIIIDIFILIIIAEIIRKKSFSILPLAFITMSIIPLSLWGQISTLFIYTLSLLILYLVLFSLEKDLITTLNITSLSFILFILVKNFSVHFSATFLPLEFFSLFNLLLSSSLSLIFALLIRIFYSENHLRSTDRYYQYLSSIFLNSTSILFLFLFILPVFSTMKIELSSELFFFLIASYVLLSFILIALLFTHLNDKKIQREQELENEFLQQYLYDLDKNQMEIKSFKHDYKNILLSMEHYLKEEDLKGMKDFYYNELQNTPLLFSQSIQMTGLSDISIKEIRSLLLSKFNSMQEKNIDASFCCESPVDRLPCKLISMIRILGILLDNAIEEIYSNQKGTISVSIYYEDSHLCILVMNDCRENIEPIYKLKARGYTTKKNGTGLGLYNLEKIKNEEKDILIETKYSEYHFYQKVIVLGVLHD